MGATLVNLDRHPEERDNIGRMLLSYGELEFVMLDILGAVLNDTSTALRALYQMRGEANRIMVVEAIAKPWFAKVKLDGQFKEGMDAAYHCKNIRNQYAHCNFLDDNGLLRFCQLEQSAKSKEGVCQVVTHPLTPQLVKQQLAYFDYAHHMLLWLGHEYRRKSGQSTHFEHPIPKPKRISPPTLDSRGEIHPPRLQSVKRQQPQ